MYASSQLLALVGAGEQPAFSPRCLTMWNTSQRSAICDIYFSDSILAVCMNRIRIVAATADTAAVYDTSTMKKQHEIRTAHNPRGLIALSPNHTACFLLYLASAEMGNFAVYDCFTLQLKREIEAHKAPLAGLAINVQGTMAASVSVKGTIVRVFSLPEGTKLYTFKRGLSSASTLQLSFSPNGPFLLLSSDSGSLHLFLLSSQYCLRRPPPASSWSSSISVVASYIVPEYYKDTFNKPRAVSVIHTGFTGAFKGAVLSGGRDVLVVSSTGEFCVYQLESESGGIASLTSQGSILRLPLAMLRTGNT